MKSHRDNGVTGSTSDSPPPFGDAARDPPREVPPPQRAHMPARLENWNKRWERWGRLMIEGRAGDEGAYEQLLRELDEWLCRYYARRLPYPAAEDARQDALLAIHAKRYTYDPSRSFGAWVVAIARYKWIDRVRDVSRYAALSLDDDIPIEDHEEAAISAASLDHLLGRLKPAQESVIRLVKLKGLSVARASGATGQSVSLVKINIHRGLKKLAALIS